MRRRLWVVAPWLLLAGSGCGRGHAADVAPAESPQVQVEVTNDYSLPVEIYAVGAGIDHRLGTVHPGMSSHFVLPPTMVGGGSVEFQARVFASSGRYRSGPILISPGAVVDLMIASVLFNSTAAVRP